MMRRCGGFLAWLGAAALLTGCGFGGDDAVVTAADRAAAEELHPQLLAEFGGAYDGDEADYLKRVGDRFAAAAGLEGQCRFTLVNSDVVNAFAVPGCSIYVTRGLMSIVNSEAELGAVLGHEVGHIVARHSQRQQKRSFWRGLGVAVVQMITGSEELTRIAGAAAGYFTLRYSRKQEYEADDLGLRFLQQAGYDPLATVGMLEALGRHEQYMTRTRGRDEARSIPEWARTHPLTDNRMARTRKAAAEAGIEPGTLPDNAMPFIRTVDGLLYGDDPEQGFVIGRAFAHPIMRIAFEAPEGFTLTNSPQAILVEGPDGMRGEFAGGAMPPGGLVEYIDAALRQLLKGTPARVAPPEILAIDGVRALITGAEVQTSEGELALTIAAYEGPAGTAYHFIMISGSSSASAPALARLFQSFRLLSPEQAAALRPREIAAVQARPGDTSQSLARRMAGDNQLAHFLMLNGRAPNQPIRPGEPLKLVVYGDGRE